MNERRKMLMDTIPCLDYGTLLNNLKNPGNIGSFTRAAHSFGCNEVVISGYEKLTQNVKRAATKKERWEKITFIDEDERIIDWRERSSYNPIVIENSKGPLPITEIEIPKNPSFILRNERRGAEEDLIDNDYPIAYIPQIGIDKSINVDCATSIVLYSYFVSRWEDLDRVDVWNCCYSPERGEVIKNNNTS